MVSLKTVFLHTTKACNLECSYCYFSARRRLPDELSTEEFGRVLREIALVSPEKIVFTGGEPLIRPDLFELLNEFKSADPQQRVKRCLNTNGYHITQTTAQLLTSLVDEVRVSLDALQYRNDRLRGAGSFATAWNAVKMFHQVGFEPKILVTVTSESLPDLEELIMFLRHHRITRIKVNLFRPIGRGAGKEHLHVDPKDVSAAIQRAHVRCDSVTQLTRKSGPALEPANCGVGRFLNIMPNGDVYPCHVLTSPEFCCGNLRHQSLTEICKEYGLLKQLAQLDLRDETAETLTTIGLRSTGGCLGDALQQNLRSSTWRQLLSVLPAMPVSTTERHSNE